MKYISIILIVLSMVSCSEDPVNTISVYRNNYDIEMRGFNVDKDNEGKETAINIELSVENNNSSPALSHITLIVAQYNSKDEVLGEDTLVLPLKGIPGYKHRMIYHKFPKVYPGFVALAVYKAPMDNPDIYMKYKEFENITVK